MLSLAGNCDLLQNCKYVVHCVKDLTGNLFCRPMVDRFGSFILRMSSSATNFKAAHTKGPSELGGSSGVIAPLSPRFWQENRQKLLLQKAFNYYLHPQIIRPSNGPVNRQASRQALYAKALTLYADSIESGP